MGKVLEKKITEQQPLIPADVNEIVELIDQAITMTRGFARGLNPVRLEADGFVFALSELAVNVEKLFGIVCRFEYTNMILIHDNAMATHLYRIVQEALNNAIKHGRADTVTIMLRQEGTTCILTVQDNGLGIGNMVQSGKRYRFEYHAVSGLYDRGITGCKKRGAWRNNSYLFISEQG